MRVCVCECINYYYGWDYFIAVNVYYHEYRKKWNAWQWCLHGFCFLHIHDCSLSQDQYFKPFTTLTGQTKSLMRTCSASEIPSYKATTVCHRWSGISGLRKNVIVRKGVPAPLFKAPIPWLSLPRSLDPACSPSPPSPLFLKNLCFPSPLFCSTPS